MAMTRRLFGAPLLVITALLVTSLGAKPGSTQQELVEVTITYPSKGSEVGKEVVVRGTASSMPSGQHLWVLARRIDYAPLWWPQREALVDPLTHKWEATAVFGIPQDVGWEFEIGVITVTDEGHKKILGAWQEMMRTGGWRPIEIPPVTSPPRLVRVSKVRQ
jgi:hypothetical protein